MKIATALFGISCIFMVLKPTKENTTKTVPLRIHDVYYEKCDDTGCVEVDRGFY